MQLSNTQYGFIPVFTGVATFSMVLHRMAFLMHEAGRCSYNCFALPLPDAFYLEFFIFLDYYLISLFLNFISSLVAPLSFLPVTCSDVIITCTT